MNLVTEFKIGAGKEQLIKMDLNKRINEVKNTYFMETIAAMSETQKYFEDEF